MTNSIYGWLIATRCGKYLAAVIDPVSQLYSNNCIKDSFTFAKEMQDLQMHSKETFLCLFDIRSLFTTVPIAETIQICADSLYDGELIRPDYPKEIFLELMNTATKSVEFSFTVTTTYTSKLMAWRWVVH